MRDLLIPDRHPDPGALLGPRREAPAVSLARALRQHCGALPGSLLLLALATSCATYRKSKQEWPEQAVVRIDSVPQGAEVYSSRSRSDVVPGEPGGDWIATGGFTYLGRTPLEVQDEVVVSVAKVEKVLGDSFVLYETHGPPVYRSNERRLVLLKAGYEPLDVTEGLTRRMDLVYDLERLPDTPETAATPGAETPHAGAPPGAPIVRLPAAGQGRLSVVSTPPGAEVLVDGKYVGVTPASFKLSPGSHAVALALDGYARWEREIETFEESDQKLQARLTPEPVKQPEGPPAPAGAP